MALVWTLRTTSAPAGWFPGRIVWSPELALFCAAAVSGATGNNFATSPDGITWTDRASSDDGGYGSGLVWTGTAFIAIGPQLSTACVQTSPDGITWAARTGQYAGGGGSWQNLAYSPSLGIAVAIGNKSGGGARIMTSDDDGVTWTFRTSPSTSSWKAITWCEDLGIFLLISDIATDASRLATSVDGINWIAAAGSSLGANRAYSDVAWSPDLGLFAAVHAGTDFSANVATSPDGLTWTLRTTPAGKWPGIAWSPELAMFVAVSNNNGAFSAGAGFRSMHSSDGITWTNDATPADIPWNRVAWSPSLLMFAAVSTSGNLSNIMTGAEPPVTVTGVSPSSGPTAGGTPVTITGTEFTGTPSVTFGGTAATSVVVVDSTTLTCVTPAHASGAVTVAVGSGSLASGFTFFAAPTFTGITPDEGTYLGGTAVTLTGTNFYGTASVTFGGVTASAVVVVSTTSITCVTPAGPGGPEDVIVTTDSGSATLTDGYDFTCKCGGATSATGLIYGALRLCRDGLLRPGRLASPEQLTDGLAMLNTMLDAWGLEQLVMFYVARTPVTLSSGTLSYTVGSGGDIDIARPTNILAASLIFNVSAVPTFEKEIDIFTDQVWQRIRQKTLPTPLSAGIYYDHGWSSGLGRIYPWPVPSVSSTQLVLYTLQPLAAFADLTTCYAFPPGYAEALRYQLALRVAREFGGLKEEATTLLASTALARVKRGNIRPFEVILPSTTPGLGLFQIRAGRG